MCKEACDRNAIEGRKGNAKRRFELDLIAAKLDETAKTEAALILIDMNAAYWLARWLLHFYELIFFEFLILSGENRAVSESHILTLDFICIFAILQHASSLERGMS